MKLNYFKNSQSIVLISFFLIVLSHTPFTLSKVMIFTFAYNRPDFIELQHKLFQKFLKDEYEFVVFDDSKENEMTEKIKSVCQNYGIKHIKVLQEIHDRPYLHRFPKPKWFARYNNASVRNCNVVQYALDTLGMDHDDLLILLESDVFLIKEFSFIDYMQEYDLAGYNRSVEYKDARSTLDFIWIGLIYLNMATLPHKHAINVNCGKINGINIDSGGHLYYYLKNHPHAHIKFFEKLRTQEFVCEECTKNKSYRCTHNTKILQQYGFDDATIAFIQEVPIDWGSGHSNKMLNRRNLEFLNDNHFMHFFGASGYAMSSPYCDIAQLHKDKTDAFQKYITTILQN